MQSSHIATEGYLGLKAAASLFERSLMARDYPALKFSYHRGSKLLELVDRQGKPDEFTRIYQIFHLLWYR